MNTSTTVAAGQIRDEMIANIKTRLMQDAHMMHARLKVTEAAQWLRDGAPGRAAEALNIALQEFERADQVEREGRPVVDILGKDCQCDDPACECHLPPHLQNL